MPMRGFLKVFLGMAPGVGKTEAILKAGTLCKARGVDVVIGYIDRRNCAQAADYLANLESIPPLLLRQATDVFEVMDIDAVLKRKPSLVLVDRMEQVNAPGARHLHRYQEIIELIDRGFSVYTTLNVHHLESLRDTVRRITGVAVQETVPDSVLDLAAEIELIDIPPEELLQRYSENKIDVPAYLRPQARDFFRKGNLTALREIALRTMAKRVNVQLADYMQRRNITGPWKTTDRLLVGVCPSPNAEELIRWTSRKASAMDARWLAVSVARPQARGRIDAERLRHLLDLVCELGGEVVTTVDDDIAAALVRVARERNIPQIVVGKTRLNLLQSWLRGGSIVDRLLTHSNGIDIAVVENERSKRARNPDGRRSLWGGQIPPILPYGVIATIGLLIFMIAKMSGGSAAWHGIVLLLGTILGSGIVFAFYMLMARVRGKELIVRQREEQSALLHALVAELATAQSQDAICRVALPRLAESCGADVMIYPACNGVPASVPLTSGAFTIATPSDSAAPLWTFTNSKKSGRFTATFPDALATYYPLAAGKSIEGVAGLRLHGTTGLSPDHEALVQMFLHQVAASLERERLRTTADQARLLAESDRLYNVLFNSISHELRTPLATVTGASSSLLEGQFANDKSGRDLLIGDMYDAARRLNRLVANLLDMSRLGSGKLQLNAQWCDCTDVFNAVADTLRADLKQQQHTLEIVLIDPLPLLFIDSVLFEQVLVNIVFNAIQYTPAPGRIMLRARFEHQEVVITVEDDGPGFSPQTIDRLFDKFYRVPGTAAGGCGLGLSIARGFIEIHGGTIVAENAMPHGARFCIALPAERCRFMETTEQL